MMGSFDVSQYTKKGVGRRGGSDRVAVVYFIDPEKEWLSKVGTVRERQAQNE
jgi:hypothetical protein